MFNIITKNDYEKRFPNCDKFNINDMNDETMNTFLFLTSAYRYMFAKYIIKTLELKKYDQLISKNTISFLPVKKDEMDIYQLFNSDDLTYLYLRNNIHLVNLTNDERKDFFEMLKKYDMQYTSELEEFISSTYRKVIYEDIENNYSTLVNFGPISQSFMAPNNSLVIGIRFDEFNLNGKSDSEWDSNHNLQLDYISEISAQISTLAENRLKIQCFVIKYNEFSIIK